MDRKPTEFECPPFEIPRTQLVLTLQKSSLAGTAMIRCIALDGCRSVLSSRLLYKSLASDGDEEHAATDFPVYTPQ